MREIDCTFTFESAHKLTKVPASHKCARMHGHSFKTVITVERSTLDASGFVVDFDVVRHAFEPIHMQIDHNTLNDVPGLENPTSENVAEWIFARMMERFDALALKARLVRVRVEETPRSGATYPPRAA